MLVETEEQGKIFLVEEGIVLDVTERKKHLVALENFKRDDEREYLDTYGNRTPFDVFKEECWEIDGTDGEYQLQAGVIKNNLPEHPFENRVDEDGWLDIDGYLDDGSDYTRCNVVIGKYFRLKEINKDEKDSK